MVEEFSVIGKRVLRKDDVQLVAGRAKYVSDMFPAGMLYAKVLRSPHPHARIVGIDASKAKALPGVHAVLTHKDIPQIAALIPLGNPLDEYVLQEKALFVGDHVCAVAAETAEIAEEALELIDVKYEVLPAVFDAEEAMKPDAPKIHPELFKTNVVLDKPTVSKTGDVEKGFAEADRMFEDIIEAQHLPDACQEQRVNVAWWEYDTLNIFISTQMAHHVQTFLALGLNLPLNKVRVITPFVGSGWGGKLQGRRETHHLEFLAALFAKKTGRPVRTDFTREEEQVVSGAARYGVKHYLKVGVKKDGTLTAISDRAIINTGAYSKASQSNTLGYWNKCPNRLYEGNIVYTNLPAGGFMRGVGNPQGTLCVDSFMYRVACELGLDPLEFFLKNRTGNVDALVKGAEKFGWKEKWHKPGEKTLPNGRKHGVGMGAMIGWTAGYGSGHSSAFVKVNEDGTILVISGSCDVGQGSRTTLSQMAAEELGVPYEDVHITFPDTGTTPADRGSMGSRQMTTMGIAVTMAAKDAKQQLFENAAPKLGVKPEDLEAKNKRIYVKANPEKGISIAEAARTPYDPFGSTILGRGERRDGPLKDLIVHSAGFAEVEVDTETGEVFITKLLLAHDCGKAINPAIVEQQLYGGAVQGIGLDLMEGYVWDKASGRTLNHDLLEFAPPTLLDHGLNVEVMIIEVPNPCNPWGARGVGEPPLCTPTPAINTAIYDAIGVMIKQTPVTPDKVLKALGKVK